MANTHYTCAIASRLTNSDDPDSRIWKVQFISMVGPGMGTLSHSATYSKATLPLMLLHIASWTSSGNYTEYAQKDLYGVCITPEG